jgi:hypothetical protein
MDKFLPHDDELGRLIQAKAANLHDRLKKIDVDNLGMPSYCLSYFKTSHSKRLFFSIETSAHLLYRAIKMNGKMPADIVIMDYGAGVGTLFLLAKMIGCKKVVYCDHLEDWKISAELIAKAIDVTIDLYITGDIDKCLDTLQSLNIQCDIITSRNVIEHIYKLDDFYAAIHEKQPHALVFSSTTANKYNPASVIKHKLWHRKWEKVYRGKRLAIIERQSPGMQADKLKRLAAATRGMAAGELKNAIELYRKTSKFPYPGFHGSNTCDPSNGVWAEHLLNMHDYRQLINESWFRVSFTPGFWDTHYGSAYKNVAGKLLNRIIGKGGKRSMRLAPFIYVIAKPLQK